LAEDRPRGIHFIGWIAASEAHDAALLEANGRATNNVAESLVISWTHAWSLASKVAFELHIHTDSTCAMQVAHLGPSMHHSTLVSNVLAGLAVATKAHRSLTYSMYMLTNVNRGTSSLVHGSLSLFSLH
jgi:hypothetical protein